MINFIDRFISWIYTRRIWGVRCSVIDEECMCCQKWIEHDELFNEGES